MVVFCSVAIVFSFLFFQRSIWDSKTRLSLVVPDGENVSVLVFDPFAGTLVRVLIPGNTEVLAAGQYGVWSIGSLWELGESEGVGGELLANTVSKSLGLPVEHWASSGALLYSKGKISALVSPFRIRESSLGMVDRIRLAMFVWSLSSGGIYKIDLTETGYLVRTEISGGDSGFKPRSNVPERLSALFSVPEVSDEALAISVVNSTGDWGYSEHVSGVVDGVGGRVLAIADEDAVPGDCNIFYEVDSVTVDVLSMVLGCETKMTEVAGNFDVQIRLGVDFLKRF